MLVVNLAGLGLGLLAIATLSSDVLFRNRCALNSIAGGSAATGPQQIHIDLIPSVVGVAIGEKFKDGSNSFSMMTPSSMTTTSIVNL